MLYYFGFQNYVIERLLYCIVFGILPCISFKVVITANEDINIEDIIKFIIVIYAIMSIFLIKVDFWNYSPGRRMSISYYMLPLFICIVMQIFFFDKREKKRKRIIKYILYFIIFYKYIFFYCVFASRGALISIFACIFICFIATRKQKLRKIVYSIIGIFIIILVMFYITDILNIINNVLNSFNIYSRTIERSIDLIDEENIGNGRDLIYSNVWREIQENIFIGNGIGKFYDEYCTYPHNIILQLWHEGGILYMLYITIPIIYSIHLMLFDTKISNKKKYLLIFLFSISIIRLIMSYEYWKDNYFWIYLYIIFQPYIKGSEINGNSNNPNI